MIKDATAEHILDRLSDLKNYPREVLAPYEEFKIDGKTYYFTPGGFLYRKDPETEEVGGFFCGYLTDEASAVTLPMRPGTTGPTTAKHRSEICGLEDRDPIR